MSRAVIRGGQLNIHNLRMLRQVFFMGFMISLTIGMVSSFYFLNKEVPSHFLGQYRYCTSKRLKIAHEQY